MTQASVFDLCILCPFTAAQQATNGLPPSNKTKPTKLSILPPTAIARPPASSRSFRACRALVGGARRGAAPCPLPPPPHARSPRLAPAAPQASMRNMHTCPRSSLLAPPPLKRRRSSFRPAAQYRLHPPARLFDQYLTSISGNQYFRQAASLPGCLIPPRHTGSS